MEVFRVQENSSADDLLAQVEDRAANPPVLWDPEDKLRDREDRITDESVSGIIEEIDERESGFGPFKITVLRRRDGSRVQVAWMGTVLENRSKNLGIGDAVALRRTQPREEGFSAYANFDVAHRKPAPGPHPVAEEPAAAPTEQDKTDEERKGWGAA
jgi:hypothetical protein